MEKYSNESKKDIPLFPAKDHDMLVVLHTLLQRAIEDIDKLGSGINERLAVLENNKVEKDLFISEKRSYDEKYSDHEIRLRRIERIGFIALGMLFILEFLLNLIH